VKQQEGQELAPQGNVEASLVSVIVPVYNSAEELALCLAAIMRSDLPAFECIVIDDASTDPGIAEVAERFGVRYDRMPQRSGPALARNAGVGMAEGQIVFFCDADMLLHPGALSQAMQLLESEPGVAAVIGSYDDKPADPSLLSQYRNLYHHWNHQMASEEASTFWTGCGAIRKSVFLQVGGFSSEYAEPCIEDIELGYRLREAGHRIRLLKSMVGTHLKRWRFWDMVRTDIFRRGVPWMALLLQHRNVPWDLNLNKRARLATAAAALLPFSLLSALVLDPLITLFSALTLVVLIVLAQMPFYRLLLQRKGIAFTCAAVPLQLVFFMGCALALPLGYLRYLRPR